MHLLLVETRRGTGEGHERGNYCNFMVFYTYAQQLCVCECVCRGTIKCLRGGKGPPVGAARGSFHEIDNRRKAISLYSSNKMLQIAGDIRVLFLPPLLLLLLAAAGGGVQAEVCNHRLSIFAEAGRMECYHQHVAATEHIRVEYEVIHGGQAEAHINFMLMDPQRRLLAKDHKLAKQQHELIANETGVYQLCFDNTISTFNQKILVFKLQVMLDNQEDLDRQKLLTDMETGYQFDRTYRHMHDYMHKISVNLMRSRQSQDYIRVYEAKDRKLAESNFTLVNNWSCAQFIAMILVGLLQVFMLRSIFETDGTIYNFWQKM